jgi:predicted transcriptional regulator
MSTKELKQLLHNRIDEITDEDLLKEISLLVETSTGNTEMFDLLSAKEKNAIEAGLIDYKEGRLYTESEMRSHLAKWFTK